LADTNSKFGFVAWTVCVIAAIGFAFDTYELLMLPLILPQALPDLIGSSYLPLTRPQWISAMFFVPAIGGGIFGLLGGYLTDRFGRRRVLTGSILLYAFSALASGFSTSLEMLLFFRCTTFIGVCVEFVAATAWLAELFTNPKQREAVLGYTQAFASVGGLLVTLANYFAVKNAESFPAIFGEHDAWRYTLISGVVPAIPLILVRPFLPESPEWERKRAAGQLRRPNFGEIFAPSLRRTTIVTTLLFACCYGIAFGALQQVPQIVKTIPSVVAEKEGKPEPAVREVEQLAAAHVNGYQEIGGIVGRVILATLAIIIVGRRMLLWTFQIPALLIIPAVFFYDHQNLDLLAWGIFISGALTIGQFSFWGNYLPRVYPVHLRGTGESFAANIGGRVIGTSAVIVTYALLPLTDGSIALAAGIVALVACVLGVILTFWLPEPPSEEALEGDHEKPHAAVMAPFQAPSAK
jgi:nitrate/nitrite transporter NarK